MNLRARTALALLILVAGAATAPALEIPLKVAEPAGVARSGEVVTGGMPIGPLNRKDPRGLLVRDSEGRLVATQVTPMTRTEDGLCEWALVEFQADLKPGETREYRLGSYPVRRPPTVARPVQVKQTGERITLSNGLIQVILSKERFNLFEGVRVDRNGDGTFAADEAALDARRPVKPGAAGDATIPALTLRRPKPNAVYATRYGTVEKVTLEDPGPVRTTVRLDGTYGDGKGDEWLKWTGRVTMFANRRDVRVLYTIRNVNPKLRQQEPVKRARVTIKVAGLTDHANYLVGARRPMMSRATSGPRHTPKGSQWHDVVELKQVGPCEAVCSKSHRRFHHLVNYKTAGYRVIQHQPGRRKPIVDCGFRCDGWLAVDGPAGGVLVWLRNFTHDNPKRMAATSDGTIELDLLPEDDGNPQPYYATGAYWLGDRSHKSYEVWFRFQPEPFCDAKALAYWNDEFQNYVPAPEPVAQRTTAIVKRMRRPLQLVTTPAWYTRTNALWGVMPSIEEEKAAMKRIGRTKEGPRRQRAAGEILGTDYIHYENFHYRSEWDEPRDCIVEFVRTGERHFLTRAHTFARNYRDFGIWWNEGVLRGKRPRGLWGAGPVDRWGKFCGCHNYGAGLHDLWLVTGDRSYREAGVDFGHTHSGSTKVFGGFGGRAWGRKMIAVLRTYQVTRDPKLKAWLLRNCRPTVPDEAMRADGRALICGKKMASWMVGLCGHAIWHHWVLHKDEYDPIDRDDYRDQIVGLGRQVAKYWFFEHVNGGPYHFWFDKPKPGAVTSPGGGGPYTLSCIDMITRAYLLTGDRRLLDAAVKFWNAWNGTDPAVTSARLRDFNGMGSGTFWARQLIHELAHPRTDAEPPANVTDLKAEALGAGKVKLTWTAPKDNTAVVAYQVKHAPNPMIDYEDYTYPADHGKKWTWWAGYNVAGEPKPGPPGATESMTVTGVPAGQRYFALRARDAAPNESAMSNVVRADVK
jgi:hypothetical protein